MAQETINKSNPISQVMSNNHLIDISVSYEQAYISIPAGFRGHKQPIEGVLSEVMKQYTYLCEPGETIPMMVLLPGSKTIELPRVIANACCETCNIALIGLNTHAIVNRPIYQSPAHIDIYKDVHQMRKAEVDQFLEHLSELSFIDTEKLILLGSSEGAVTAATYPDSIFTLRIVAAWSCEEGYFIDEVELGGDENTWFLNIIGFQDEYFGINSPMNRNFNVKGHGAEKLQHHRHSKVVILPNEGHQLLTDSELAISEIHMFIQHWLSM